MTSFIEPVYDIQSVLFKIKKWDNDKIQKWLANHNLCQIERIHIVKDRFQIIIDKPNKYKFFKTKKLSNGIDLVLGYK